jgi:hypothetical protein
VVGKVVPSEFVELGGVDLSWREDTFPRNAIIRAGFETTFEPDEFNNVSKLTGKIVAVRAFSFFPIPIYSTPPNLPDGLRDFVDQIDKPYREYRELNEDITLKHNVTCIVGKSRGSLLHQLVGGLLPITNPGGAHFDGMVDANDAVIASHGGVPTRIFTGPVLKFGESLPAKVATTFVSPFRLFASHSVIAPEDTAIIIDENTLHQTAPQFFSRKNPNIFFRSFVEVVE